MAQKFIDNLSGLPTLWGQIKILVQENRFSEARLDINIQTGHLIAQESGNLIFTLDNKGHLISEVI